MSTPSLSQTKFENWLKFGNPYMKLVCKIFKNPFSSKSKIKGGKEAIGEEKMDFFSFFAFFWNFSKKIATFLKKYD